MDMADLLKFPGPHMNNSLYAERPEGVAVTLWRHFLERPC